MDVLSIAVPGVIVIAVAFIVVAVARNKIKKDSDGYSGIAELAELSAQELIEKAKADMAAEEAKKAGEGDVADESKDTEEKEGEE